MIEYDEYDFETEPPDDLKALFFEHEDLHESGVHLWRDVRDAWALDKPVTRMGINLDASDHRVTGFLGELSAYFYTHFDGSMLHISRFAELPRFAANCKSEAKGVFYGIPMKDVAQFCLERDHCAFTKERGHKLISIPKFLTEMRDEKRREFAEKGMYDTDVPPTDLGPWHVGQTDADTGVGDTKGIPYTYEEVDEEPASADAVYRVTTVIDYVGLPIEKRQYHVPSDRLGSFLNRMPIEAGEQIIDVQPTTASKAAATIANYRTADEPTEGENVGAATAE